MNQDFISIGTALTQDWGVVYSQKTIDGVDYLDVHIDNSPPTATQALTVTKQVVYDEAKAILTEIFNEPIFQGMKYQVIPDWIANGAPYDRVAIRLFMDSAHLMNFKLKFI